VPFKDKEKEKEYRKRNYEKHKEKIKEYADSRKELKKEYDKEYRLKNLDIINEKKRKYYNDNKEKVLQYHKKYYDKTKIERKSEHRNLKIKAFNKIAEFHDTTIKCWRCGETRLWVITIGHINQDGKEDRKISKSMVNFYRRIIKGEREIDDLQLECADCNFCLQWYGKYPDEMNEENFLKTFKKRN
jgi:hypothetical protein